MSIWLKSVIAGLVVATIVFFVYEKTSGNNSKKYYTIHYSVRSGETGTITEDEEMIKKSIFLFRRRIEALGHIAIINIPGRNTLDIVIKQVDDTLLTTRAIEQNSRLEIRELYSLAQLAQPFSSISKTAERFLQKDSGAFHTGEKLLSRVTNLGSLISFSIQSNGTIADAASIGVVMKEDTALINKIFREPEVLNVLPEDLMFVYGMAESSSKGKSKHDFLYLYAIKTRNHEAQLQGKYIETASAEKGFNGSPEVRFTFNPAASRIWEQMTMENKGRHLAIIVNGMVLSAPRVNDAITGGNCAISGGFTMEEAEALARQLKAGDMPAKLTILKKEITEEAALSTSKKPIVPLIIFLVAASIAFFIFKALKNR